MRNALLWIALLGLGWLRPLFTTAQTTTPTTPATCTPTKKWAAVITAHPDDWQLFMGGAVGEEARRAGRKVVFVCLTAGQGTDYSPTYWQSRQASYRASVRQASDLGTPKAATTPTTEILQVNGHAIEVHRYRNTVACFLHLPDGGYDGNGLGPGGFQSLKQLKDTGKPLAPLNGASTYTSWQDLSQTVRALLAREAVEGQLTVHAPQPDKQLNPGDHSDHRLAGALALAATTQLECRYQQYVGYNAATRPINLPDDQRSNQLQIYKVYCQTMTSLGQYNVWDEKHLNFMGHQYYEVVHQVGQPLPVARPTVPTPAATPDPDEDEGRLQTTGLLLEPNFPNPFSQSSLLVYYLPAAAPVSLRVLNLQGQVVLQLLDSSPQLLGRHEQWLDVRGFPAAGTYIAELRVGKNRRFCELQVVR